MKKLTNEELCAMAKSGDEEAKRKLVEQNHEFICTKANAFAYLYQRWGVEADDLIQVGSFALYQAIEKYDSTTGTAFITYAGTAVLNEMRQYVRNQQRLYINRIQWQNQCSVVSLDERMKDESGSLYHEIAFDPTFLKPEQVYIHKETMAELYEALDGIGERERRYLLYRYGFEDGMEHSRIETAGHFRFTDSRMKLEEQNALSAIRHELWVVIPEKRYTAAEDKLTRLLVSEGELHAVELRLKSQRKMGKKIKSAVYEYLADYDGTWGEIQFDIAKGTAEIVSLADGDTVKSNRFALRAMEQQFEQTGTLPEKITLTFVGD